MTSNNRIWFFVASPPLKNIFILKRITLLLFAHFHWGKQSGRSHRNRNLKHCFALLHIFLLFFLLKGKLKPFFSLLPLVFSQKRFRFSHFNDGRYFEIVQPASCCTALPAKCADYYIFTWHGITKVEINSIFAQCRTEVGIKIDHIIETSAHQRKLRWINTLPVKKTFISTASSGSTLFCFITEQFRPNILQQNVCETPKITYKNPEFDDNAPQIKRTHAHNRHSIP